MTTKSLFDEKVHNIKNKLGNLLILTNHLEKLKREKVEGIKREEIEKYFFPSKFNKEKIDNNLSATNNNFEIDHIIHVLEKDLTYFKKFDE